MNDLIREAITEHWGERCPDIDADCACCKAWAELDALEAAQARIEAVRRVLAERPTLDVAETALYAWNLQADEANDWSTLSAEKQESIKAVVAFTAGRTRSAIRALTEAVRKETVEECARVADANATNFLNAPAATIYGKGYQKASRDTAAAIRALTEAKEDRT